MSDFMGQMFGAQLVANEIAHQGRMNRRHNDRLAALADDNAILRQRDAWLVNQHNTLARNFNELMQQITNLATDYDKLAARNVELQERVRTLQETVQRQDRQAELDRLRMHSLDLQIKTLHQLGREHDPDAFPVDDI